MKNYFTIYLFLACVLFIPHSYAFSMKLWIETEGGTVFQTINDVEIPTGTATRFSLTDFSKGPWPAFRFYTGFEFMENHELRLLAAPLEVSASGVSGKDIFFNGQNFRGGQKIKATYMFNSYRLTYRYKIINNSKMVFQLGFTGKIRDAEIALFQENFFASRENTGFVPLLHLNFRLNFNPVWAMEFDVDGMTSPYGRAEDASLKVLYKYNHNWEFLAGYRLIEGGSDGGGKVYNFALLHFAVISIRHKFF